MKLLIYTHEFPPFLGGLATTSFKLANGIGREGFETTVLAPGYSLADKETDDALPCKVVRIPGLGSRWIKLVPFFEIIIGWVYLMLTLVRVKPDIVLFITEEAETAGGLLPYYSFKPVVRIAGSGITTCFHGKKITKRMMSFPMRRLYDNASLIIAVSESTKELLCGIGVRGEKIKVIYNGVNQSWISEKPKIRKVSKIRKDYGINKDTPVLLTVARVLPRKGQDMVIKALPIVLGEFPSVKYFIVGDGRYKEKFEQLAKELGVSGNVIFTGGVKHENTMSFFDLSDIFIMPNRYWNNKVEGLPNSLLEAAARSKPLIAGDHGGSREAVINNETGFLVDPESVEDIANAILAILGDSGKASQMGASGKKRIEQLHTEKGMIDNYTKALKNV